MHGHTYSKRMDQPGKIALNRENIFPCPRSRPRIWSPSTISELRKRKKMSSHRATPVAKYIDRLGKAANPVVVS